MCSTSLATPVCSLFGRQYTSKFHVLRHRCEISPPRATLPNMLNHWNTFSQECSLAQKLLPSEPDEGQDDEHGGAEEEGGLPSVSLIGS